MFKRKVTIPSYVLADPMICTTDAYCPMSTDDFTGGLFTQPSRVYQSFVSMGVIVDEYGTEKHKCDWCRGITYDDSRGNCCACGAPRSWEEEKETRYVYST